MFWTFFWFRTEAAVPKHLHLPFFHDPVSPDVLFGFRGRFRADRTREGLDQWTYALGPAILRDFQRDTCALIFTKPITKFDYLGGKWLASFVVTLFVFSGLVWGGIIGTFMP
jgi:hypothetical protein